LGAAAGVAAAAGRGGLHDVADAQAGAFEPLRQGAAAGAGAGAGGALRRPRMTEEIAMPIEAKDVRWVEDPKMGVAELLYLPAIFAGLTVTFRHLFKRPMTQEFPEV